MINQSNFFKVFFSAPSDVIKERKIVEEVAKELNVTLSVILGVHIEVIGFGFSSHSSASGEDAQGILNKQFGEDYDIYIGVLWKKFGTPTPRDVSGTMEEFNDAYSRFKKNELAMRMAFYFNTKIENLNKVNTDDLIKINDFKKKLQTNVYSVVYEEYNSYKDFERLFRCNISIFINELLDTKMLIKEYSLLKDFVKKEFNDFIVTFKKLENINSDLDKFLQIMKPPAIVNIKDWKKFLKSVSKGSPLMQKFVDDFDDVTNKQLGHLSNIIIYVNGLSSKEVKKDFLGLFKFENSKLIQTYETTLSRIEVVNRKIKGLNDLGEVGKLSKILKVKYLPILENMVNNFKSYYSIASMYQNFIEKTLKNF